MRGARFGAPTRPARLSQAWYLVRRAGSESSQGGNMSKFYLLPVAAALLIAPLTVAQVKASPLMQHGLEAAVAQSIAEPVRAGGGRGGGGGGFRGGAAVRGGGVAVRGGVYRGGGVAVRGGGYRGAWPAADGVGMAAAGGPTASAAAGHRSPVASSGCAAEIDTDRGGPCPPLWTEVACGSTRSDGSMRSDLAVSTEVMTNNATAAVRS
jgi:hypothetical protein